MRYVTVRVTPTEGVAFHPLGEDLATDPAISRGAIHRNDLLDDGTGVLLAEATGDLDRYREILTESEYVLEFSVTAAPDEDWWYSYTHYEPTDLTREMLAARRESEMMIELPIEVHEDGSMVFTYVGDEAAFEDVQPPATNAYEIEILRTGEHRPDVGDLYATLTARQRTVLDAALDLGYYQNPREATHEDVANVVGVSPSTVGEHLRKIEANVFAQFER